MVNTQQENPTEGVVILPGAGHGPFGDMFDIIAYELAGVGKRVLRYESWTDYDDLDEKTLAELHEEVDAAVEYLQAEGCSTIHLLAKSFGGGIALSHVPDAVDRLILWAPAVEVGAAAAVNDPHERLGESEGPIGVQSLDHIGVPVRILRGTEAQACPETIVNALSSPLGTAP